MLDIFFFSPSFPPPAHTCYLTRFYTTSSPQKHAVPLTTTDFTKSDLYRILERLKKEKSVYLSEITYLEIVKSRVAKRCWILTMTLFPFALWLFREVVVLATTLGLAFFITRSSSKLQRLWLFPLLSFSLSAWSVLNGKCAALLCTASGSQFAHYVSWDSCLWLFGTHLPLWGFMR